ncbi:polyunsaturated fatty acid 5-lipoxygenase-like [Diadema antillarum]|uniref:polyunsaturated fatty acid 5-lipoxygenase-like n=1 Tax=Diadema antillarum TaxID=105358 RepID=UPI003A8B34B5
MGEFLSKLREDIEGEQKTPFTIRVKTGDCRGAGTDANIFIALHGAQETRTKNVQLSGAFWQDNFERGQFNTFNPKELVDSGPVMKLEVWRDNSSLFNSWFVDLIEVERHSTNTTYVFPVNRWVKEWPRLQLVEWDCRLPQDDMDRHDQRLAELRSMQDKYQFDWRYRGLMPMIRDVPDEELQSNGNQLDVTKRSLYLSFQGLITRMRSIFWNSLDDLGDIYGKTLPPPACLEYWEMATSFGIQRLAGCNPTMIRLCKKIPDKLPVTDAMLQPLLEGMTKAKAIHKKRLFIIDYAIMKDLPTREGAVLPAPIALFFLTKDKELLPVAIQLFQERSEDNPIFLPTDPKYTWMLAKMWFNLADASYHQSVLNIGMCHFLMETVAVATHRCLSPSHPLYRLLAPHFRFLLGINHRAYEPMLAEDGWIQETLTVGTEGTIELIRRAWKTWDISRQGHLLHDMEDRDVDDPDVLPNYHYRDDGMLIYEAIEKCVRTVVNGHYGNARIIKDDPEVLEWGRTLAREPTAADQLYTCGIKGIPGNGLFKNGQQLTELLTSIIYTCSAGHAAVAFTQYENYGLLPFYPGYLRSSPPKDKAARTEADVLDTLPPKDWTIRAIVMSRLLSNKETKCFGDYEVQYMYDPIGKRAIQTLKQELKNACAEIERRNANRDVPYHVLHPCNIPNSIAI